MINSPATIIITFLQAVKYQCPYLTNILIDRISYLTVQILSKLLRASLTLNDPQWTIHTAPTVAWKRNITDKLYQTRTRTLDLLDFYRYEKGRRRRRPQRQWADSQGQLPLWFPVPGRLCYRSVAVTRHVSCQASLRHCKARANQGHCTGKPGHLRSVDKLRPV